MTLQCQTAIQAVLFVSNKGTLLRSLLLFKHNFHVRNSWSDGDVLLSVAVDNIIILSQYTYLVIDLRFQTWWRVTHESVGLLWIVYRRE